MIPLLESSWLLFWNWLQGSKGESRESSQKDIAMIQMRDGSLGQGKSSGSGEKWLGFEYIL